MHAFLLFLALLAMSLLAAAFIAFPVWLAVGLVSIEPIHRVMQRIAMIFALVGLVLLLRRLGLANRQSLGYSLPRAVFLKQMAVGFAAGLLLMLPLVGLLFGLGVRELHPEFAWHLPMLLAIVGQGMLTGVTVAFIEETFFRGAMQTAIRRESGPGLAILLPSLLYASLHFLGGRLRLPPEQVEWASGFAVLANLFEKYASPLLLADSLIALVAVGVLLALVRERTGAIAGCIGLHAGWVCVITSVRSVSAVDTTGPWAWLVGSYDGVIGWGALVLIALIIATYIRLTGGPGRRARLS